MFGYFLGLKAYNIVFVVSEVEGLLLKPTPFLVRKGIITLILFDLAILINTKHLTLHHQISYCTTIQNISVTMKKPFPFPSNRMPIHRKRLGAHRSGEGPRDMSRMETSMIKLKGSKKSLEINVWYDFSYQRAFSNPWNTSSSWWFQPIWNIFSQNGNLPPNRDEHKKYLKPPPSSWL